MRLKKFQEKVKEQQEKVGEKVEFRLMESLIYYPFVHFDLFHFNSLNFQIQTVAKTAGMHPDIWVENADRWVAGFLEMFEEGCHKMVSSSVMIWIRKPVKQFLHFTLFLCADFLRELPLETEFRRV